MALALARDAVPDNGISSAMFAPARVAPVGGVGVSIFTLPLRIKSSKSTAVFSRISTDSGIWAALNGPT